jgi:hypothetical protein
MTDPEIRIGDRVRIRLDEKSGARAGWYEGVVFKIEPYSEHRSFYWVEFDAWTQSLLGARQVSVFNPKNIQRIDPK